MRNPWDDILKKFDLDLLNRYLKSIGFDTNYPARLREIAERFSGFDASQIRQFQSYVRQTAPSPEQIATALKIALPIPAPKKQLAPKPMRWKASIGTRAAARRMEAYIESKGMDLKEFAKRAGTTDRTLRKFRKTGLIRRSVFDDIARAMQMTRDELLKS